jgi:hypothetical protein
VAEVLGSVHVFERPRSGRGRLSCGGLTARLRLTTKPDREGEE